MIFILEKIQANFDAVDSVKNIAISQSLMAQEMEYVRESVGAIWKKLDKKLHDPNTCPSITSMNIEIAKINLETGKIRRDIWWIIAIASTLSCLFGSGFAIVFVRMAMKGLF